MTRIRITAEDGTVWEGDGETLAQAVRDVGRQHTAAHRQRAQALAAQLRGVLPPLYSQEHVADPLVRVKLFLPGRRWTWYLIEFDGQDRAFGLVVGQEVELGSISLSELTLAGGFLKVPVERDESWTPRPLSWVREHLP